jgi:DNA-directed RNA polymerase specialized sigma24 family protein
MSDVTRILNAIEQGDEKASEKLLPLVYEELRLLAAQKMSQERPGQTLQATALVRRKGRIKHGGDRHRVELDEFDLTVDGPSYDLVVLDECLERLQTEEQAIAELVKLRFYAGLTLEQAAKILEVSTRTAIRYWVYAQAWLYKEMDK